MNILQTQVLHQTCGPLHVQTAECYTALAMAYYNQKVFPLL